MDCPDCGGHMICGADVCKTADVIKLILTCANCGTRFFGTLYRVETDKVTDEEEPF